MGDVLVRAYPAQLERRGPRTVTGRLVPYGVTADVLDMVNGQPEVYQEGFRRGAFARQAGTTERGVLRRIGLIHKHEGGLGYLGPFTALREADDGLWGDAEVLRSKAGDVEDLLAAGVDELSVEFRLAGRDHTDVVDGVRWRTHAHLEAVALEPKGAYSGAQVMAFRAEVDEEQAAAAAEAQAAQEAAALAAEEERVRAAHEAELLEVANLAADRRARFDALAARYDTEAERQRTLIREYGLTIPPLGARGSFNVLTYDRTRDHLTT